MRENLETALFSIGGLLGTGTSPAAGIRWATVSCSSSKAASSALSYDTSCDAPPTDAEIRSIATWLSTQ